MKAFLKRKNIEISLKRYGIDALGAMAQGLFCLVLPAVLSLLVHALVRKAGWVKDGDLKLGA